MENYKRAMQISGLFAIIAIGSLMRLLKNEDVRNVTLVTAISTGVVIGVFVTNAVLYFRRKDS